MYYGTTVKDVLQQSIPEMKWQNDSKYYSTKVKNEWQHSELELMKALCDSIYCSTTVSGCMKAEYTRIHKSTEWQ